jgi:hypothetical protein
MKKKPDSDATDLRHKAEEESRDSKKKARASICGR